MKTREDIISVLRELKPMMQARYKLRSIGLFGSYARGDQTAESDVDILVDLDPAIGIEFVDMADAIERRLRVRTDVVVADGIKSRYRDYIQKDLIYV